MTNVEHSATREICPYCGGKFWVNSGEHGKAKCTECQREFNIGFVDGVLTPTKLINVSPETEAALNKILDETNKTV